ACTVAPVTVTLMMVVAAVRQVVVPLLRASLLGGPAPLKPSHCPLWVLRPFWFDTVVGAAEALARTYVAVPAPTPTSSMTSTRERVENLFLVGSCVATCDIFLDPWTSWDEDGCSPRNPLKSSKTRSSLLVSFVRRPSQETCLLSTIRS